MQSFNEALPGTLQPHQATEPEVGSAAATDALNKTLPHRSTLYTTFDLSRPHKK